MTKTAIAIRHVAFEDLGILQPLLQSAGYSVHDREAGTLVITEAGRASPLHHLGGDVCVLHWHGDTFDLPNDASLLASTAACENQAYSLGPNVLGLQFNGEVDGRDGALADRPRLRDRERPATSSVAAAGRDEAIWKPSGSHRANGIR